MAVAMMLLTRNLAVAITALITCAAAAEPGPQPHAPVVTCTNPASGATWKIRVDYDQKTVDSNAARISDTEISWHDVNDGGNYTLDRKSGKLTVVVASSTGGYFLWDRCGPEN